MFLCLYISPSSCPYNVFGVVTLDFITSELFDNAAAATLESYCCSSLVNGLQRLQACFVNVKRIKPSLA